MICAIAEPPARTIAERDAIILANRGLAHHVALKWANTHNTMTRKLGGDGDVVAIALWALVIAAEGYDPTKGKFSTYAGCVICRILSREAMNADTIRIPLYLDAETRAMYWDRHAMGALDPSAERDVAAPEPEEDDFAEHWPAVAAAMQQLPPRLARILRWRAAGRGLGEIGRRLDLSKERVRQLEKRGLREMRRALGVEGVRDGGFPSSHRRDCKKA